MSTIRAAQLIFTRVEPDYSPQRKSGFQTVYKSESLSPAETGEIEKRIQCFQPNQSGLTRRQFFVLSSGKVVLTHTMLINTNREIVDKAGRGGAFLAHCLILDRAEFHRVDHNPFTLLNYDLFLNSAEEMVERFGKATGYAEAVQIEIRKSSGGSPSAWSGAEAQKMVALAFRAEELSKKGQSVLLVGRDNDIIEALMTVFYLTPRDKRLACTFDTCIERCPIPRGSYWAVGANTRQSGSSYIEVNATKRQIVSQVGLGLDDKDLYLGWLRYVSSQESLDVAMNRASTIQELAVAFEKRTHLRSDQLDQGACQEFMNLYEKRIIQDVEVAITKLIGKSLARLLIHYVYEIIASIDLPNLLSVAASQSLKSEYLNEIVVKWISDRKPELKDKDWKTLQELARQSGNMRLLHLSATLGKKIDAKVRDEALARMDEQVFQDALDRHLMNPIAPADFVTPSHLGLLFSHKRLLSVSDEQFVNLVEAVIKANAGNQLRTLFSRVRFLSSEPLAQLEKMVKKQSSVSRAFKEAIYARREELGSPPRRFGLF